MQCEALRRSLPPPTLPEHRSTTRSVARALASVMLAAKQQESAVKICTRTWPDDEAASYILRAAATPTSTATASSLTPTLVGSFLRALAPVSAATRLFERAIRLDFDGVSHYVIPYPSVVPVPIFIGEGQPFPLVKASLANSTVGPPHKILIGSAVTSELEAASPESAATIIGNILADQTSRSFDKYVFDNVAADTTRPAGILNGVTPITADAGGSMAKDIIALVQAIATAGGHPEQVLFVAGASSSVAMRLAAGPQWNYAIFGTSAIPAKTLIAIDPTAIATGYSGLPTVDTTIHSTAHFEDTTPLPIASGAQGSGVLATPVRSAFQTDTVFLRCKLNATWATLRPGVVQTISNVGWA
jgi:hypothetical protein